MNRDDELTRAMMRHPSNAHKMLRDVEAFAREAASRGIDVAPLRTASEFHAEVSRAINQHGRPWQSKSRPRKAKWHNIIGTGAAYLLLVLALFIILSAVFASAARADTADDWASIYGSAVCDTLDSYPTVSGLAGVLIGAQRAGGLTDEQAGEAVAVSVITRCPEYRGLLAEFVRRHGPVVA